VFFPSTQKRSASFGVGWGGNCCCLLLFSLIFSLFLLGCSYIPIPCSEVGFHF
jgi:hypothetical protein